MFWRQHRLERCRFCGQCQLERRLFWGQSVSWSWCQYRKIMVCCCCKTSILLHSYWFGVNCENTVGGLQGVCVCVFGIPYSFKLNPYKISQQSTWSNLCAKDLKRKEVGTIQHSLNYKTLNRRHVSEFDSVIRLINVLVNLQPQMLWIKTLCLSLQIQVGVSECSTAGGLLVQRTFWWIFCIKNLAVLCWAEELYFGLLSWSSFLSQWSFYFCCYCFLIQTVWLFYITYIEMRTHIILLVSFIINFLYIFFAAFLSSRCTFMWCALEELSWCKMKGLGRWRQRYTLDWCFRCIFLSRAKRVCVMISICLLALWLSCCLWQNL